MPDLAGVAPAAAMTDDAAELSATVERVAAELATVSPEAARRRPAPEKWSAQEILGHLVDSAVHNLVRFVNAPAQDDLVFPGYDQDVWVAAQHHQETPWIELVALWRLINRQVVRVMAATAPAARMREHRHHNLDRIAWQLVPGGESATLDYLMRDYVAHLQHHLRQIAALLPPRIV